MSFEKRVELEQKYQQELDKIRKKAEKGDVTFDLNRWFRERMSENDPELLEIQKQGFLSEGRCMVEINYIGRDEIR